MTAFQLHPPLIDEPCHPACRASVLIPARNEEHALPQTLDALRTQVTPDGVTLDSSVYEVIVLLNNCTDGSVAAVERYQRQNPGLHLFFAERSLPGEIAHVGTARRMLMDSAYARLAGSTHRHTAILSTDADTTVSSDWVSSNLRAVERGAEVVGGVIHLKSADLESLDAGTLAAYYADRRYQRCVAQLESLLDPDPADPWPRHLEHFGASMACTPCAYERAGGLPPVKPLEDVAFIDALRRVDARIRHDPEVQVFTSARLDGRAEVGLSGQLRIWQKASAAGQPQMGESAAYLAHRFSSLAQLRYLGSLAQLPPLTHYPSRWHEPVTEMHRHRLSPAAFLCAIDCNRLIEETFEGSRKGEVDGVIADLETMIARLSGAGGKLKSVPTHRAETDLHASSAQYATRVG